MTTEYQVRLDRAVCDGVFACLIRDERFSEATDGLATIGGPDKNDEHEQVVTYDDGQLDSALQAARACPVDAIDVTVINDEWEVTGIDDE